MSIYKNERVYANPRRICGQIFGRILKKIKSKIFTIYKIIIGEINMKNKYFKKYVKLRAYLELNYYKISGKKYMRLSNKLSKLKDLQYKELLINLGINE